MNYEPSYYVLFHLFPFILILPAAITGAVLYFRQYLWHIIPYGKVPAQCGDEQPEDCFPG